MDEINKKNRSINIFIVLSIIILMFWNYRTVLLTRFNFSAYVVAHWGISYDSGFILRGLLGEICTSIFAQITPEIIFVISASLALLLLIFFSYIFINIYKQNPTKSSLLLILFLISQPSNIRWWVTKTLFGKIDSILMILFILSVFVIIKMRNIKLICLINIILSIIAMLFHEAYVVFYCATIFALIFYKDNYSSDKLRVNSLLYCIPVLVGFVIITSLGKPSIPHEVLVEMIKSNLDQTIRYESINLTAIQYSSVSEKIAIVTKFLKETPKNIISSILTILYLAPLSVVFITILIKKARKDKKTHIIFSLLLLGVSCLIPLVSALFGYDFFRWLGISVICVSSVLIATVYIDGDMNAIINKLFAKRWKIILPISLVYLFGGNLGALISTPLIERVSYVILHYIS